MGILDYLLLGGLGVWLAAAIRSAKKKPGCGGSCAGCRQCGHCQKKP